MCYRVGAVALQLGQRRGCAVALEVCLHVWVVELDAVLLGVVGGPKWDDPRAAVRPEGGLLGLRKALGVWANLRPVEFTVLDYGRLGRGAEDLVGAGRFLAQRRAQAA